MKVCASCSFLLLNCFPAATFSGHNLIGKMLDRHALCRSLVELWISIPIISFPQKVLDAGEYG
jgi:hypothetical protein